MSKKVNKNKPEDRLPFTKMTGAGNDFLIFDARSGFPDFDRSLFARSVCRRTLSVGADGVVFIETATSPQAAFKWDFYNADGSHAEMCGNAARCVARFAVENDFADRSLQFETAAGMIHARVRASGAVEVDMTPPKILFKNFEVKIGEHLTTKVLYINTGVPHVVKENDDWDQDYLNEMGSYLRNHPSFKATNGTNATFYEVVGTNVIQSATFERGVEAVTLACGTGAVAAAAAAVLNGMSSPVEVRVPGGTLHVDIDKDMKHATLAGEARFLCRGEILPEALL